MKENFVGKRISSLRLAKGISARKLSLELGQSENYINHIENGQGNPSLEVLEYICDYFEISMADFFDDKTRYPLQYRSLIEELNKLDSLELEKILEFVKMITSKK